MCEDCRRSKKEVEPVAGFGLQITQPVVENTPFSGLFKQNSLTTQQYSFTTFTDTLTDSRTGSRTGPIGRFSRGAGLLGPIAIEPNTAWFWKQDSLVSDPKT